MNLMTKKYGVMLIGCGHIGEEHIADIYFRDNIRIEAVVDQNEARARLFAAKYRARQAAVDYRTLLDDPAIDIVIIATYADTHLDILRDCLQAGKHVLCEKPLTPDLASGLAFYRLVKQASSKVLIAHILRHNRSYQKIAELIQSGAIGRLRLMRMVQNHHAKDWPRYQRLMADCPPVVDCGVHYIDVMQWVTGAQVREVSGMGCRIDPDAVRDNYGMIQLQLDNGCIGYYEAGWSRSLAAQNLKEFIGETGRISLTLRDNRADNREEGDLLTVYHQGSGEYQTLNLPSKYKDMYAQLCRLIEMIEQDEPGNPTIDEAFSAFYVAIEAEQAILTGQPRQVSYRRFLQAELDPLAATATGLKGKPSL
ncbi:Gfo/Idh/MocA family oxidoreductase [Oscillospiraceae bacterium HV4-5-C5C]|nr:Gfo/Idh/MocA family oxidoreductase [Oscillospiraceae bacterium HV4-5-C5C]